MDEYVSEHQAEFQELLLREDWDGIATLFERLHPQLIAESLSPLRDETVWTIVQRLPVPKNAEVISYLEFEQQIRLMSACSPQEAAACLNHMAADDRVDLMQKLDAATQRAIFEELEPAVRRDIERLALYEEGSAGAVMSTDVVTLQATQTVEQVLARLRSLAHKQETIYYNYVVDERGKLLGIVSLRALILADPQTTMADLMSTNLVYAWVNDDQVEVARKIREFGLLALPILHGDHRLAGVVTVDDAQEFSEEEVTEDFHRMASIGHLEMGLREAGVALLYRKRIPWLMALVFFNIFSGAGIAYFEDTIKAYAALVFFLPLLIDSGGNAGAQSATLMIRALALGNVGVKDWFGLLLKEMAVAALIGVTMALGVGLIGWYRAPEVMLVVTATMILTVFVGSLVGMLLPFLLTRLKLDPATASAPLITSVADVFGVLIYFSIATWYLGIGT